MVMLVSLRIDRILVALLATAALAGASLDSLAQQQEAPKRNQQQKPAAKPAAKPAQNAAKPKAEPVKPESYPPSQIGIGTPAQYAFMVDPQTSSVLLFKDADKPMHPSSMAKMMTIYILFDELPRAG
jgi:D-alanyl-D-alanine carboxypeptidase (penicillin-binding protein 5/6)